MSGPDTRPVESRDDVAAHFDGIAADYREAHGRAGRLLRYRLRLLRRRLGEPPAGSVVLEIGCGTAVHLLALARDFDRAIGTDLSGAMVAAARQRAAAAPWGDGIDIREDAAEELATVPDMTVDAAICVGALEHMWDRPRVLAQVRRVLRPGGRFICLTPNGGWVWYTRMAPRRGHRVHHLASDRFFTAPELTDLTRAAGLTVESCEPWTFVPRGDMPRAWSVLLSVLDQVGRVCRLSSLRGGLLLSAVRPTTPSTSS